MYVQIYYVDLIIVIIIVIIIVNLATASKAMVVRLYVWTQV